MHTVEEAAIALGITVGAVHKAIQQGRLRAERMGGGDQRAGLLLIPQAALDAYPRRGVGRPPGSGAGTTVRISRETGSRLADRTRVTIGRAAWALLGAPPRIKLHTQPLALASAGEGEGYKITIGRGAPRFLTSQEGLTAGVYAVERSGTVLLLHPQPEDRAVGAGEPT